MTKWFLKREVYKSSMYANIFGYYFPRSLLWAYLNPFIQGYGRCLQHAGLKLDQWLCSRFSVVNVAYCFGYYLQLKRVMVLRLSKLQLYLTRVLRFLEFDSELIGSGRRFLKVDNHYFLLYFIIIFPGVVLV